MENIERIIYGGVFSKEEEIASFCEIPEFLEVIQKLIPFIIFENNYKKSYAPCDFTIGYTIQYMVDSGIAYITAATKNFSHVHCFKLIDSFRHSYDHMSKDMKIYKEIIGIEEDRLHDADNFFENEIRKQIQTVNKITCTSSDTYSSISQVYDKESKTKLDKESPSYWCKDEICAEKYLEKYKSDSNKSRKNTNYQDENHPLLHFTETNAYNVQCDNLCSGWKNKIIWLLISLSLLLIFVIILLVTY